MRMLMATRIAAVAVGLCLVSGTAMAAPDSRRGSNETAGADEQKHGEDARDRGRRGTKPVVNPAPAINPTYPGVRESGAQNERQRHGAEGARTRNEGVRNAPDRESQLADRARDNRDSHRTFGERNDRRVWGDRNGRQHINLPQYRRNFNAPRRYRAEAYQWRNGNSYRRYGYGQRLPRHYFPRNVWIANFLTYDLFAPPPGYIWVRYGPDAFLIDRFTGEIVQVRYGMFYM